MRLSEMIYTEEEMQELRNENKKLKEDLGHSLNRENEMRIFCEEKLLKVKQLEEKNQKLKLHIEAKDKAYTALLKDYEEIKEQYKELKAEIGEWLDAIRNMIR